MRFIGREIDTKFAYNMFKIHPYTCLLQAIQKIRQIPKLDYKFFNDGTSFYPTIVTFEVTHRCNLRCKTCWFWGEHGKYSKGGKFEEMSLDEIKSFLDSISSFKPYLLLTGGEPLLYPEIEKIIKYASSKGIFVGLITNGMLATKEKLKKIIEAGLNFITVSIDAPNADLHNQIRNNKSSFDNCINTLKTIKELRGKKSFPIITTTFTISNYNFNKINGILETVEPFVDILQFQHQWFTDSASAKAYAKWAEKNLNLNSHHIGDFETSSALEVDGGIVFDKIQEIRKRAKIYVRVYPDLTREETIKYYEGVEPVYNKSCINPWFGVFVKPNGDIVPCIDYVIGNVKKDSFQKIWNSEKMKLFRKKVKEQKFFPGCTRCCGFFCR